MRAVDIGEDRPFRTVGEMFLEVADDMRVAFTRAAAAEGLTYTEARTLRLASFLDEQASFTRALGVPQTRVSALLRRLEEAGLIRRKVARGDNRARVVVLTDAGDAALVRLNEGLEATSPLLRHLDDERLDVLRTMLLEMLDDRDAPPAD